MKNKKLIFAIRIIIGILAIVVTLCIQMPKSVGTAICVVAYIICAWDVMFAAVKRLVCGSLLDENFLMTAASVCALALGETVEAIGVIIFYQVGEMLTDYAVNRGRKSLESLAKLFPDTVTVINENQENTVEIGEVKAGDIIKIRPGERVPLDCRVIVGQCSVDTSAVTGESIPKSIEADSVLSSGFLVIDGVITAEVINGFDSSTLQRMMEIVEESQANKSKSEKFITKFARIYTPCVVLAAIGVFLLGWIVTGNCKIWLYRAMTFMMVSCPCALVLSVPLAFFCGISGASENGILIKGGDCMEKLGKLQVAVFDKTGTLTTGEFEVCNVQPFGISANELVNLAAAAESGSNHPIARCIANSGEYERLSIESITEKSGLGIEASIDGKRVIIGGEKLLRLHGITYEPHQNAVHIAIDGKYSGYIEISDKIRNSTQNLCEKLAQAGVKKMFVLTGDSCVNAKRLEENFGFDGVIGELSPIDKVNKLKSIKNEYGICAFVGDGINDAPVISAADVGFSMGHSASDAAVETADVILLCDEPEAVADAVTISKKTMHIAKMNTVFCIAIKIAVLVTATVGLTGMWAAVAADVGVALLACINSLRAMR